MAIDGDGESTRVSVSLSTLRAELGALELRLVDRLNGALQNKADRAIVEQHTQRLSDMSSRILAIENTVVKRDGPVVQKIEAIEGELASLREVGKYKRWLWAQTAVLGGIAVALTGIAVQVWG